VLEVSTFRASYRTSHGVDLCRGPFEAHGETLSAPDAYAETHPLGAAMRASGVEAFRYGSARDVEGGVNVGLFSPRAFAAKLPESPEGWSAVLNRDAVEFVKKDLFQPRTFRFSREQFEALAS